MEFHRGRLIDHIQLRCANYYAAFVLDPDGNNIEAVHHGEAERSAESVVIRAKMPG